MLARVVVAAAAILVLAWLGVMERDTRLLARGKQRAEKLGQLSKAACARSTESSPDCKDFAGAVSDARRAEFLNADTTPELFGGLLRGTGQWRRQAAVVKHVLRLEPNNLGAWTALLVTTQGHDPRAFRLAKRNLRRLDPLSFRVR